MISYFFRKCLIYVFLLYFVGSLNYTKGDEWEMEEFLGFKIPEQTHNPTEIPKTLFQTNRSFDPGIAIPSDGVILHCHGAEPEDMAKTLKSWQEKGYLTQRMFFADSDAGNIYTTGKFDGIKHPEDIEKDQNGNPVLCAGVRPYMVPTKAWIQYLETQAKYGIDGGARAILPEEPLAHKFTGYEEGFKKLFLKEYGAPWKPPHESPDAFFKTCRLKNKLYITLEQELQKFCANYSREKNQNVDFLIPIHSMYSNLSAGLVAPLGTSLSINGHQGYIGQIWTGPVLWSLQNFSGKDAKFFDAAYLLYDYFVNLVLDRDYALYLLTDPVEDHPGRTWSDYKNWFKECAAAELLFGEIDTYELMPWPERIFLPGHKTGGGTPGPMKYRTTILSILTALQDMPKAESTIRGGTRGIGMLIGDSAMWQHRDGKVLDPYFSILVPLLKKGIPVSSVPMERIRDEKYRNRFNLLILCYDAWKPERREFHEELCQWVKQGGVLLLFDGKDRFDTIDMFWKKEGFPNAQAHLLKLLGVDYKAIEIKRTGEKIGKFHRECGKGHVVISRTSPEQLTGDSPTGKQLIQLIKDVFESYTGKEFKTSGELSIKRGPYLICHTFDDKKTIPGKFIDVFSTDLKVIENPDMQPNSSMILFDISEKCKNNKPCLVYSTYRLTGKKEEQDRTSFFIRGPEGVEGKVRLFKAGRETEKIEAFTREGGKVETNVLPGEQNTLLLGFQNHASGIGFCLKWK